MTKDLEEAIKNADRQTLIEELFRGYSFAIPAIGACHPYNEIKAGKTSPALEHMKKNRPECYKFISDLVAKDKAAEAATPQPKVCLHHIKVGSKYVVKKEFSPPACFMCFEAGKELEITEMDLGKHEIKFIYRGVKPAYTVSFLGFCELTENGTIEQKEN